MASMAQGKRTHGISGCRCVAVFALACLSWSGTALGAVGYRTPFLPEQCGLALAKAQRLLRTGPNDLRARMINAEALLCSGLQDDPEALDRAIDAFQWVLARDPTNFFARLYLAEAIRGRFPISDMAVAAFAEAQRALNVANVGAGRAQIEAHIANSIREVTEQQRQSAATVRDGEIVLASGNGSPHQVGEWLMLIARTGPQGVEHAAAVLDKCAAEHPDPILSFYRAEMLRDRTDKSTLTALYRAAAERLCREGGGVADRQACTLARWRLQQLVEGVQ
jgi:hypothetical protein